ncbi:hypothetical protein I552_8365 [Mycobacterium xenopi 3993]|nr:hypothetical protein I552_8365 [Mycobacterium xenopi 3993]
MHEDGRHGDAYLSELPDLSGPSPRPGQRKPASEHPTDASPSPGPGRPTGPEPRLHVARRPAGRFGPACKSAGSTRGAR